MRHRDCLPLKTKAGRPNFSNVHDIGHEVAKAVRCTRLVEPRTASLSHWRESTAVSVIRTPPTRQVGYSWSFVDSIEFGSYSCRSNGWRFPSRVTQMEAPWCGPPGWCCNRTSYELRRALHLIADCPVQRTDRTLDVTGTSGDRFRDRPSMRRALALQQTETDRVSSASRADQQGCAVSRLFNRCQSLLILALSSRCADPGLPVWV